MASRLNKKIIVCCDGTWQDADDGYTKPSIFPYQPYGILQVPSNVVRISRALVREDYRGKPQIAYYQSGVGTGSTFADKFTGGLLGTGISEHIREGYAFITTNYVPGDEIILIGFSRGAYTVRSIAGLIRNIGLLTRTGMANFYPIFRDVQNSKNRNYHDIFPSIPFPDKPRGKRAMEDYKMRLEENDLTRVVDPDGTPIGVLAVAVWDTVGSLGIPTLGWMQKLGFPHATKELKFYDTAIGSHIKYAFQALALDEHRSPFSPSVWEKRHGCRTDLRQVWFPGSHSNVGGGYDDQEMADVTLAWMMDQLASIGVEFQPEAIDRVFEDTRRYYENPPKKPVTLSSLFSRPEKQWAISDVYEKHKPVRPWAIGQINEAEIGIYKLTGRNTRSPGEYKRADPDTGKPTDTFMTHTNERIHSSVRIRLELEGLGLDDKGIYDCPALLKNDKWRLRQTVVRARDSIPPDADWAGEYIPNGKAPKSESLRWVWEWNGPRDDDPPVRTLIEENLGPYEKRLLRLNDGSYVQRKHRRRKTKS